ncbi:MAG: molybdopterin-dependent oxidoreductase [Chloroflexi bacterium]|nr:molybdopterin-dependent oxidoreductase [Chloroflexota bacterium]
MATALFGDSVKRTEDPRLITGRGKYVDDIRLTGMTHMAFVRSPYAHANIRSVDTSAAANAPGVLTVFTGADLQEQLGGLPVAWLLPDLKQPPHPPLAYETVRYVGDAVAVVVADTAYQAADAAELVDVDYEILPAIVNAEAATKDGAPQLHSEAENNIAWDWNISGGDYDEAIKDPDVIVIKQRIINQRLIPNSMETRGVVADFDSGRGNLTLYTSTQIPHFVKLLYSLVTGHPEQKIRVVAPDVGGGFGSKISIYAEEIVCGIVSKQLGRPVKWIESRSEAYIATTHGRDHITDVEIAGKKDGEIVGIKVDVYANIGAYLSTFAPLVPTWLFGLMLGGVYKMPNVVCRVWGVFTNTTPVDAYRGAGRPEATFLLGRMVSRFAQEIGRDPIAVRRKNMLAAHKNGRAVTTGVMYDSGDYKGNLNKALEIFDYRAFRSEQRAARRAGKLLGVGISTYIEITGAAPSAVASSLGAQAGLWESSNVRVHPTGKITVYTGSSPHGQGHETTLAQLVSSELGVPMEDVEVLHGDTDQGPFGVGTFGSRSLSVGGAALFNSLGKIKAKAHTLAAHLLESDPKFVTFEGGSFAVEDIPDKSMTFQEVAGAAYGAANLPPGMEPGLEEISFFDPTNFTWPFGTHICVVEIDEDTGQVSLVRYVAVDDVGNVLNPMIVDGMVHGGVAQGIGQALTEQAVYTDDGQLLSGSLMDYALPSADMFPMLEVDRTVTPSPVNPLGVKGAGECGTIAASPAVMNAVIDALAHLGVKHMDMPATSEKVWRAIRDAKETQRAARAAARRS